MEPGKKWNHRQITHKPLTKHQQLDFTPIHSAPAHPYRTLTTTTAHNMIVLTNRLRQSHWSTLYIVYLHYSNSVDMPIWCQACVILARNSSYWLKFRRQVLYLDELQFLHPQIMHLYCLGFYVQALLCIFVKYDGHICGGHFASVLCVIFCRAHSRTGTATIPGSGSGQVRRFGKTGHFRFLPQLSYLFICNDVDMSNIHSQWPITVNNDIETLIYSVHAMNVRSCDGTASYVT